MDNPRLEVIRAILAQAESTPYPEEADAFNAKAAELMARYSIDEAMLARDRRDGTTPLERRLVLHRPYTAQKALLVNEVAGRFGCRAVRLVAGRGQATEVVSLVGYPADLELVETLVTSLLVQLTGALARGDGRTRSATATASWRRSFIAGFVEQVAERLAAERAQAERDTAPPAGAPSVAVVLADRDASVDAAFRTHHPRVRSARVSVGSSVAGLHSGRVAGANADLGGRRLGGRRSLPA